MVVSVVGYGLAKTRCQKDRKVDRGHPVEEKKGISCAAAAGQDLVKMLVRD